MTGDGPGVRNPHLVRPERHWTRTKLDDGSFRETETYTTFDPDYGLPQRVANYGQLTVGDNTCTQITYNQVVEKSRSSLLQNSMKCAALKLPS